MNDGVLDKFCKIWVNMVFKYLCGIFLYKNLFYCNKLLCICFKIN